MRLRARASYVRNPLQIPSWRIEANVRRRPPVLSRGTIISPGAKILRRFAYKRNAIRRYKRPPVEPPFTKKRRPIPQDRNCYRANVGFRRGYYCEYWDRYRRSPMFLPVVLLALAAPSFFCDRRLLSLACYISLGRIWKRSGGVSKFAAMVPTHTHPAAQTPHVFRPSSGHFADVNL